MRHRIILLTGLALIFLVFLAISFSGHPSFIHESSEGRISLPNSWFSHLTLPGLPASDMPLVILFFLIVAVFLIFISQRLFNRRVNKIREAMGRIYRGEWGASVSPKEGGLGGLADDFNKMSRRLREIREEHLGHLNDLTKDNLFRGLLSQMILGLQRCLARDDLYAAMTHFLSLFFPEDSGTLFIRTAPDKLEPVAIWGPDPRKQAFAAHNCQALWKWQMHCGAACDCNFNCPQGCPDSLIHICIPIDKHPEVGLLQILSKPDAQKVASKQRHGRIVAEHIGLLLVNLQINEGLLNLALRDPLTGLFNRRFLEETLQLEFSRAARQQRSLGIIMIDLDHFKKFNDAYGHPAGDALLKEVGLLLQRSVRSCDIACRYGGEEFTLVLSDASEENILRRAEELRDRATNLRIWHIYRWLSGVNFSAGVAIYPEHGRTPKELLSAADRALYRAKETGRNRVCLADGVQFSGDVNCDGIENQTNLRHNIRDLRRLDSFPA